LMRGVSGKFAQTTAIAAAAAILAVMVVRPAFFGAGEPSRSQAPLARVEVQQAAPAEATVEAPDPAIMAEADYKIEVVSARSDGGESESVVTQDYGLDHIDVASYESEAYAADMALSGFTSTGVASLVY